MPKCLFGDVVQGYRQRLRIGDGRGFNDFSARTKAQ